MKLDDNSRKALFEKLDRDNDTGVATEDLVAMVEAHHADVWEDLTDEYLATLKKQIIDN